MWLIIYREGTGWPPEKERTCYSGLVSEPPEGAYNEELFEVKEWHGVMPKFQDFNPETGEEIPGDLDPTLADPDYEAFQQAQVDFDALADLVAAEVAWLEETIPTIETMTLEELRGLARRLAQENLYTIRAWRYVLRRLG